MHKIGIIGAGMITEKHLKAMKETQRMQADWITDISQERLDVMKKEYGINQLGKDYKDFLKDPQVDSVLICTPPVFHKEMFIECLKAGKHVFLEKPAALNPKEITEMIRISKSFPDALICECSARHARLQPRYTMVKEMIDSGALGHVYYIHHNSVGRNGRPGIEYNPEAKWFLNKAIAGGGPLLDWGVYDLSFHLGILDDKFGLESVQEVMLKSGLDNYDPGNLIYDVEEMFTVHLKLDGGIRYFWERGNHANMEAPNETRIYGTRGGLKLGFCSWDTPVVHLYDYDKNGKPRHTELPVSPEDHSDDGALIEHFADILDGKTKPAMPLELAGKHLNIIWECYAAADKIKSVNTIR